jgi:hypothetical protein
MKFQEFMNIFSKEASNTFLKHREEYDHKIELEIETKLP